MAPARVAACCRQSVRDAGSPCVELKVSGRDIQACKVRGDASNLASVVAGKSVRGARGGQRRPGPQGRQRCQPGQHGGCGSFQAFEVRGGGNDRDTRCCRHCLGAEEWKIFCGVIFGSEREVTAELAGLFGLVADFVRGMRGRRSDVDETDEVWLTTEPRFSC